MRIAVSTASITIGLPLPTDVDRPNPIPAWFRFHEVFHGCTVLAFISHYVAVALVIYAS